MQKYNQVDASQAYMTYIVADLQTNRKTTQGPSMPPAQVGASDLIYKGVNRMMRMVI